MSDTKPLRPDIVEAVAPLLFSIAGLALLGWAGWLFVADALEWLKTGVWSSWPVHDAVSWAARPSGWVVIDRMGGWFGRFPTFVLVGGIGGYFALLGIHADDELNRRRDAPL